MFNQIFIAKFVNYFIFYALEGVALNMSSTKNAKLTVNDLTIELPIHEPTLGCPVIDIKKLTENGFNIRYTHPNLLLISWLEKPKKESNNNKWSTEESYLITSRNTLLHG